MSRSYTTSISYPPLPIISRNITHVFQWFYRVYCQRTQYFKDPRHYSVLGFPNSLALGTDPHQHRETRALVQPMFSKKTIIENASIHDVVEKLCVAFEKISDEGKPVPFSSASYCATVCFRLICLAIGMQLVILLFILLG
jgi:cytochrome P450